MIEKAIAARLGATSAVTDLVSTRFYHGLLPQDVAFPAIVFFRINTERDDFAHDGPMGVAEATIQVSCYGERTSEVMAVSEAVRTALYGWSGTAGGVNVLRVTMQNELFLYEADEELKNLTLDLSVLFRESTISP